MHMTDKVCDNAMQKENKELYMFFKNMDFPYGGGALKKAEEDLYQYIEMCNIKSLK
jgi:heat shock protein HslJ